LTVKVNWLDFFDDATANTNAYLAMFTNYLKIALRNLYKHRSFTIINLFGLVAGLSSAFVLALIAYQQLSFDGVHEKASRIHLVYKERTTPSGIQLVYDTWVPTLEAMKETYSEIESGMRHYTQPAFVQIGTERYEESLTFADASLFQMFSISTQQGDGFTQLNSKASVILSGETATRFFGSHDAIGKLVHLQLGGVEFDFTVSGILNDVPVNSSVRPAMLVSFENALDLDYVQDAGWDSSFLETYVLLNSQDDAAKLESQFPQLVKKVYDEETAGRMKLKLISLADYHNQLTNSHRMAYIMLCIALIIIVVAVVNYINLATVRSIERSKEIGLRKVLGATRLGLARQFLGESFVLTMLSFLLAVVVVQMAIPLINPLLEVSVDLDVLLRPVVVFSGLLLLVFIAFASGSFPALLVARYQLADSIKGKWKTSASGTLFRKGLIVFQFTLAAMLLFGSVVIYKQVAFMKAFDTGVRQDHIIVVPTDTDNMIDPEAARLKVAGLKKELLRQSGITHVASSNIVPSDVSRAAYTMYRPDGWTEEQPFRIMRVFVDESYFDLYDVPVLEGDNFIENPVAMDTSVRNFSIINEAAMKAFGWNSIEGKKTGLRNQVVGLVPDHHYTNLSHAIEPIAFVYRPAEQQASAFLSVRFTGSATDVVQLIQSKWETLDNTRPFTFFFVDKNFEQLYQAEDRNIKIITWFSGLAIAIACLGLLGLISFTIELKTKEIGIRKVLGSSASQILFLLNREFIVLISVSLAIAFPLATFILSRWLQDFAVRVSISWWWFVPVALVALVLAFAVTGLKAWRAAAINTVDSLRSE
jgi:putative ABC transport system permease protein